MSCHRWHFLIPASLVIIAVCSGETAAVEIAPGRRPIDAGAGAFIPFVSSHPLDEPTS